MKDRLSRLFQERFQGHEAPVDPGTWQAIQGQLMTPVTSVQPEPTPGKLQAKFAGHEVHVDAAVWQNISTQLGHSVAAGSASGGFLGGLGWAAAGVAGLIGIGGLIYVLNSGDTAQSNLAQVVSPVVVTEAPVAPAVSSAPQSNGPASEASRGSVGPAAIVEHSADPAPQRATAATVPDHRNAEPQTTIPADPEPATQGEQRSGVDVVNDIIAQMTTQVQQEVRSHPTGEPTPNNAGQPPAAASDGAVPNEIPAEQPALPELFLPNTFTPNGDGVNDLYRVSMTGFTNLLVRVYSLKNNQLVFSADGSEPWTGANCEEGMYMVAVEAVTPDGRMVTEGKVVWLNRTSMN